MSKFVRNFIHFGVEQQNENLRLEIIQLKQERDGYAKEAENWSNAGRNYENQLKRMEEERQVLNRELSIANSAKCYALIRAEEVKSKEVSFSYREQRLENEREAMQRQNISLTEELNAATKQVSDAKRDQLTSTNQLLVTLEEKNGQIRILEGREEAFNVDKEAMQSRIESLVNRLKDARDANTHQEEGYNAEIKVQTGLANCFKTKASDAKEKCSELTEAVETLQNLLNTSSEKYGTWEASLENEKKEKEEEINRRNEAIRVLRKELEDAIELIKTLNHDINSENMKLISPSAAAASKAVKSGTRLTQIYSQLLTCQEDLANEKKEHQLLKEYNDELETERQLNASEKEKNENIIRQYSHIYTQWFFQNAFGCDSAIMRDSYFLFKIWRFGSFEKY